MFSECDFVSKIQRQFSVSPPVEVGIGDDGAVLNCEDSRRQVVVTDMLLDGVHFDLKTTSATLAGRKAVAVNLSDLAAMGCRPTAAFVSIAIPRLVKSPESFLADLYEGLHDISHEHQFTIAGGDTNSWDGPFAINVCLTGVPFQERPLLRSGAMPGDHLFVTGPLGGSLGSGRHLTFEPKLHISKWLTKNTNVHAMMDISDGLAVDLYRMMHASGTGAVLQENAIPIHSDVAAALPQKERLKKAISDGEDFELLFAVSSEEADLLNHTEQGQSMIDIGTVTDQAGTLSLRATDGAVTDLPQSGWQHL